ncbi:MAG: Xaa-Pro aminopeptidase [Pseudomonadota bacterium]
MKTEEFAKRRQRLMKRIGKHAIAIVSSAEELPRSRDVNYPFRQNSDFWYLSGFNEPEALLILLPNREEGEYVMFNRERDRDKEIWEGYRAGQKGVKANFGVDQAFPIDSLDEMLPRFLEERKTLYYGLGSDTIDDMAVVEWIKSIPGFHRGAAKIPTLADLNPILHDLRLIKSSAEISVMKQAAKISGDAHCRAMQSAKPGFNEQFIEGEFLHAIYQGGAKEFAYPPIIASGENACILHYTANDQVLQDGDLLLIDAGCELENYASDITRTFPVSGQFTKAQAAIYDLVLAAQLAAIEKVKPGNYWNEPHDAAVQVLTQGLVDLGLLKGSVKDNVKAETYKKFYMHKTGHWLGLDVHDVGRYEEKGMPQTFKPGMVLTVEPGIYVNPDLKGIAKKWRGIGIRIEDDVLVTKKGCEVLTHHAPKERKAIEALMRAEYG